MNQTVMTTLQNEVDISVKIFPSNIDDILSEPFPTYRKYGNTYDHIALTNGIFDETPMYDKIKDNID